MDSTQKMEADAQSTKIKDMNIKNYAQDHNVDTRKNKLCRYCLQKNSKRHICPGKYIYEFIMESFFKRVFLDTQPCCYLDLYHNCKLTIVQEHLFPTCSNIDSILYQNLVYYIYDYEF